MTNREILNVIHGLAELREIKVPLNIKTSYILARNDKILSEYATIINSKQIELYKKWGNIEDNKIVVPLEKKENLENDLEELLNIDNKVQIVKLHLQDFGDVEIPFNILEDLFPIIIEE